MAWPFGKGRGSSIRFQSGGRYIRRRGIQKGVGRREKAVRKLPSKKESCVLNQKLENQTHKGLSLDPQRNHQNKLPLEEEQQGATEQVFHGQPYHHPYLQQLQDPTLLYGRLERLNQPPPPQPLLPTPPAAQQPKKRSYYPASSSSERNVEHARLREKMGGDTHHQNQTNSSRLGLRHSAGEIVEVQGGHIVRSIGRKDRHSKVCTARGPRDRRLRLSAHTAIQFYDVQDRLGYDRPSKAVDWLIKKAKAAIDQLAELPAWHPTAIGNSNFEQQKPPQEQPQRPPELVAQDGGAGEVDVLADISSNRRLTASLLGGESAAARYEILNQQQLQMGGHNQSENNSSFLPPSLNSEAIADTIKSFFPMGASTEPNSSSVQFSNFPQPDLLSRTSSQSQDLRLSLQSFQGPILLHHQQPSQRHHSTAQHAEQTLFSGTTQLAFDSSSSGWSEHHPAEIGRFQRLVAWNVDGDRAGAGGGAFVFNPPTPTPPMLQPFFGQNQFFSQRGPLQSSNNPSVRAWIDPSSIAAAPDHLHHLHQSLSIHPSSFSGSGFASGGGFSGFQIPARIQGEEEEHDGISDKPSSASSDSRH